MAVTKGWLNSTVGCRNRLLFWPERVHLHIMCIEYAFLVIALSYRYECYYILFLTHAGLVYVTFTFASYLVPSSLEEPLQSAQQYPAVPHHTHSDPSTPVQSAHPTEHDDVAVLNLAVPPIEFISHLHRFQQGKTHPADK